MPFKGDFSGFGDAIINNESFAVFLFKILVAEFIGSNFFRINFYEKMINKSHLYF